MPEKMFQEALEVSKNAILSDYPKEYKIYIDIANEYANFLAQRGKRQEAIKLYQDVLSTIDKIKDKMKMENINIL